MIPQASINIMFGGCLNQVVPNRAGMHELLAKLLIDILPSTPGSSAPLLSLRKLTNAHRG